MMRDGRPDGWSETNIPPRTLLYNNVWDEITYPFLNFNAYTAEV